MYNIKNTLIFIFRYIPNEKFVPNIIKNVSKACEGLCKWIRALDEYDKIIKVVAVKRAKLYEAEAEYDKLMETLNAKRTELRDIENKLQLLLDQLGDRTNEKNRLQYNIDLCSQKLLRAEQLINGLSGEKDRWKQTSKDLQSALDNAIGDILISSGVIAYLGAFTVDYRNVRI